MAQAIIIWSLLSGLILIGVYAWTLIICYRLPNLSDVIIQEPVSWPLVSIIIPACNEEQSLAEAMQTRLKIDYPTIEFILIDDRSTDNTGKIVDQLSQEDNRIIPIHIKHLPEGWIGKVYALDQGTKMAKGSWILYSDADVLFQEKDTLKKAVAFCEFNHVDHLTLIPWIKGNKSTLLELAFFSMSFIGACFFVPVTKKDSKRSTGIGAFNLIRKSVFDKSKGFQWLKMEAIDDLGLSVLMKEAGGHNQVLFAVKNLKWYWYDNFSALAKGLEKNGYGLFHYNLLRFLVASILFIGIIVGPFLVFTLPYSLIYFWPLFVYVCLVLISIQSNHFFKRRMWTAFFSPVAHLLFVYVLIRSAILFWVRGGIYWRGTFYSGKSLRENQRYKH